MTILKVMAVLALLPALARGSDSDNNRQEKEAVSQPTGETTAKDLPENTEVVTLPDLKQIDSFGVQMGNEWRADGASKDESTALIVNPFSVRKRGRLYGSVYEYHREV